MEDIYKYIWVRSIETDTAQVGKYNHKITLPSPIQSKVPPVRVPNYLPPVESGRNTTNSGDGTQQL